MFLKTITLENETSSIQQTIKSRLQFLFQTYKDLEKWTFTDHLLIQEEGHSHSHPVLTLAAKQLLNHDNHEFLSVYVHENLHWFVSKNPEKFRVAMNEIRLRYPIVEIGRTRRSARNEESTYVHIIVCYLEYLAVRQLLGEKEAIQVLSHHSFYEWIYRKVLEDRDILHLIVLDKCGLDPRKAS